MSTRPRPRPKPRPRVPSSAPLSSPATAVTSLPDTSPVEAVVINVDEDEDAFFLKNRNRSLQTWKQLDKLSEVQDTKKSKLPPETISDTEGEGGLPHRRKYKRTEKGDVMPAWTKSIKQVALSSDDEDDDILEILDGDPSARRKNGSRTLQQSSKRQRSRSRSLTPPPTLPSHTLQHARETIRRMLGVTVRAASPAIEGDESIDNVELDPELARIANQVKVDVQRQASLLPASSRSPTPSNVGGGPEVVQVKVRWRKHPLNSEGKAGVWGFQMKRHDSFKVLFDELADIAEVLVDNVIVTYEGKRIFASASPHGIGVWAQAEFEACDKLTFEYLQTHRHRSPAPQAALNGASAGQDASSVIIREDSDGASEADEDSDDEDTFKITLRASTLKPHNLTVRQTTKCSAILAAFLKHHGLTDKYPSSPIKGQKKKGKPQAAGPALVVDGDRLDPNDEISVADLEDGDMVEVVGL